MKDYAKVFENKVIEIKRNANYKPAGSDWLELEKNKPNFDKSVEYIVIDYYEILEDKVIEHFKIEPINFEPMPVEEDE